MVRYCKCGCGKEIIIKPHHKWYGIPNFILGHSSMGHKVSKTTREKISKGNSGKVRTEEMKNKIRKSDYHKNLIGINNPFYKKHHSKKTLNNLSKNILKQYKNGRVIWNKDLTAKTDYRVKKYTESMIKTISKYRRITSYEKEVIRVIEKYNLPYKYTGNGTFFIGTKNPDFININGEKIAIEVFYEYWKIRDYGSVKNYKKVRKEAFNEYGWKTIFIDSEELKDEKIVLNKLGGFKNGKKI